MENLFRDTLVALGHALIAADFHVFTLPLVHELLESSVVVLGDSLGCHLDDTATPGFLDLAIDSLDGLLEQLDTQVLIQALAGQDVQGRSDQLDLDLVLGGIVRLGGAKSGLDGVDSVVAEAGDFDISTNFGRGGSQLLADVLCQLLLDGFAGKFHILPHVGVPIDKMSHKVEICRCAG